MGKFWIKVKKVSKCEECPSCQQRFDSGVTSDHCQRLNQDVSLDVFHGVINKACPLPDEFKMVDFTGVGG
jgi:hypothetical protein